jgi:hypothetical protein
MSLPHQPQAAPAFTIPAGQGFCLSEQRDLTEREPGRFLVRLHDDGTDACAQVEAFDWPISMPSMRTLCYAWTA